MKIAIQDLDDQSTRGLGLAYHLSRIETILWNPDIKPIFDLFGEIQPELVIVYQTLYRDHAEELRAAQMKYGGHLFVVGLEMDDTFMTGRPLNPCANIIDSITKISDKRYESDVSMIVDYVRPNDVEYIKDIGTVINDLGMTFRIYGKTKLNLPNYVGRIEKSAIQKIYNNSRFHIDLYGEHFLTPFLYGNRGLCELQYHYFGKEFGNYETIDQLAEKLQEKISHLPISLILEKHTNFDAAANILGATGFSGEALKVLSKKKEIIDEYWSRS